MAWGKGVIASFRGRRMHIAVVACSGWGGTARAEKDDEKERTVCRRRRSSSARKMFTILAIVRPRKGGKAEAKLVRERLVWCLEEA